MKTTWAFIKLSRPHFLAGGALMYAVGAYGAGVADAGTYLAGQGLVSSAQITAHYVNEYADVETDRFVANRTIFSGGSGVLSSKQLSPNVALRAARSTTVLSLVLAGLVLPISTTAALVGVVALMTSWAYSMPPLRLLATGWGELVTSITVVGLVPVIGATVNGGSITAELMWGIAALLPIHLAMMLAFELPDLNSDRRAGKTVLAVRLGEATTTKTMAALLMAAAVIGLVGTARGDIDAAWPLATASGPAVTSIIAAARSRYVLLTVAAVGTLVVFAAALLVAG